MKNKPSRTRARPAESPASSLKPSPSKRPSKSPPVSEQIVEIRFAKKTKHEQAVRTAFQDEGQVIIQNWPAHIPSSRTISFQTLQKRKEQAESIEQDHECLEFPESSLRPYPKTADPFESLLQSPPLSECDLFFYDYLTSRICFQNGSGKWFEPASSLESFLRCRALCHGSSLQGRRQAASTLLGARKQLPVLIAASPLELWLPTSSRDDSLLSYISFARIASLQCDRQAGESGAKKNRVRIVFVDGLEISLDQAGTMERVFRQAKKLCALLAIDCFYRSSQSSQ